jgi:hypothetical protein
MIGYVCNWHQPNTQPRYGIGGLDVYGDTACDGGMVADLTLALHSVGVERLIKSP